MSIYIARCRRKTSKGGNSISSVNFLPNSVS